MRLAEAVGIGGEVRWRPWVVLAAVYLSLAVPWPGLGRAFVTVYAAVMRPALVSAVSSPGTSLRATGPDEAADAWDLAIRLPPEPGSNTVHGIRVHLRRTAYLPLAFLAALFAAFPPARSRRWSLIACPAFLLLLQFVALVSVFVTRGLADYGAACNTLVIMVSRALFEAPVMQFALPAMLWAVLGGLVERMRAPSPSP
jgi:hypothetical protein